MTSLQLINKNLPALKWSDAVSFALQLMQEQTCNHLPITDGNLYKGMISKSTLLHHENPADALQYLTEELIPAAVNNSAHFLRAVSIANLYRTDVIPVINEASEYQGSITHLDLVNALGNFCGAGEYGALIVLEVEKSRLNISELNAIMESNGASMLHLNMSPIAASQMMEVTIGLDKKEISAILANLIRYGYKILFTSGEDLMETELADNYYNLMNYLDI